MLTLSSIDIKKQEFKRSLRGFDESEVSSFLESVATQWQEQQDELRRMEDRVGELEGKISHYQKIEEALQQAISSAKSSSAAALEDAQRRAELILEEARMSSKQITNRAMGENERLKEESSRLSGKKNQIVARLRAFLTSELEMLEYFEHENPTTAPDQSVDVQAETRPDRLAPLAQAAVAMHSQSFETDDLVGSDAAEDDGLGEEFEYEDSPTPEYDAADAPEQEFDSLDVSVPAEREPVQHVHDWTPKIGRTSAAPESGSESPRYANQVTSWPSDAEEVMNPDAEADVQWEGDTIEPDEVFAGESDEVAANDGDTYNVSQAELDRIRRILDDLD